MQQRRERRLGSHPFIRLVRTTHSTGLLSGGEPKDRIRRRFQRKRPPSYPVNSFEDALKRRMTCSGKFLGYFPYVNHGNLVKLLNLARVSLVGTSDHHPCALVL